MNFIKLNTYYESEPNIAYPDAVVAGKDLLLTFPLNYFIYPDFKDKAYAKITFADWFMYRIGDPNDEGFELPSHHNATRWNNRDFPLEFHNFYEVQDSDWREYFDTDGIVKSNREDLDLSQMKHYIFFMKDGTIEVIASGFNEQIPV